MIDSIIADSITGSIETKKKLFDECRESIKVCGQALAETALGGGKIMFCGNGGSAADSQHLAAELVIRLRSNVSRRAVAALALTVDPSIMTAGGNDIGYENIFARCVEAYGQKGDVLVGISTSGNSENVIRAVNKARELGIKTIGLLGSAGGKLAAVCSASVIVPSGITARIQESHILIGHIWCEMIEEKILGSW